MDQPEIKDIVVEAEWDGDPAHPLDLTVSIEVFARQGTQLSLINQDHSLVESTKIISIEPARCFPGDEDASSLEHNLDYLSNQELPSSPTHRLKPNSDTLHAAGTRPIQDESQENGPTPQKGAATVNSPSYHNFFAQSASLYDDSGTSSVAAYPSPFLSPTQNISVRKRLSQDLDLSKVRGKTVGTSPGKSSAGRPTRSIRKYPVPLEERPPWRLGGDPPSTRGRYDNSPDQVKRRVSRSAGPPKGFGQRKKQRRSSLPGHMIDAARVADRQAGTMSPNSPTKTPRKNNPLEAYGGETGLVAAKRLHDWLHDRSNPPTVEDCSNFSQRSAAEDFALDAALDGPPPEISPSPTPSSCADLPWTSTQKLEASSRDLQAIDEHHTRLSPTVVIDNGIQTVVFGGSSNDKIFNIRFHVKFEARIRLELLSNGSYRLAIPGLPKQPGNGQGLLMLTVEDDRLPDGPSAREAFENILYVDENMCVHSMGDKTGSAQFALSEPLFTDFLCYQERVRLSPDDYKLESGLQIDSVWPKQPGQKVYDKMSLNCCIRMRRMFCWAETISFTLFLWGGPRGKVRWELGRHKKVIDLGEEPQQQVSGAGDCLEMSFICRSIDLVEPFTITWKKARDNLFDKSTPRISNRPDEHIQEQPRTPQKKHVRESVYTKSGSSVPGPCPPSLSGFETKSGENRASLLKEPFSDDQSTLFKHFESQMNRNAARSRESPIFETPNPPVNTPASTLESLRPSARGIQNAKGDEGMTRSLFERIDLRRCEVSTPPNDSLTPALGPHKLTKAHIEAVRKETGTTGSRESSEEEGQVFESSDRPSALLSLTEPAQVLEECTENARKEKESSADPSLKQHEPQRSETFHPVNDSSTLLFDPPGLLVHHTDNFWIGPEEVARYTLGRKKQLTSELPDPPLRTASLGEPAEASDECTKYPAQNTKRIIGHVSGQAEPESLRPRYLPGNLTPLIKSTNSCGDLTEHAQEKMGGLLGLMSEEEGRRSSEISNSSSALTVDSMKLSDSAAETAQKETEAIIKQVLADESNQESSKPHTKKREESSKEDSEDDSRELLAEAEALKKHLEDLARRIPWPATDTLRTIKQDQLASKLEALQPSASVLRIIDAAGTDDAPRKRPEGRAFLENKIDTEPGSHAAPMITSKPAKHKPQTRSSGVSILVSTIQFLKLSFILWVLLRAFDHQTVVHYESVAAGQTLRALEKLNLDIEPVPIWGDPTGWQHVMLTLAYWKPMPEQVKRLLPGNEDKRVQVIVPLSEEYCQSTSVPTTLDYPICAVDEELQLWLEQHGKAREGQEKQIFIKKAAAPVSRAPKGYVPPEQWYMRWLDQFDMALGWQPPVN